MRSLAHHVLLARTAAVCALVATVMLSGCAPAEDVEALLADLHDRDIEVRVDAADKLERLVRKGDYASAERGLNSANPLVRVESIRLLSRMSQPGARRALRDLLRYDRRMMLPYNPIAMKPSSNETDSRILVAQLIGRGGGDPEAVAVLLDGIDVGQPEDEVQSACYAIGALGDPMGIPFLAEAAQHSSIKVVRAAAQALGQFKGPEALAVLRGLVSHPSLEVRSDVLSSLLLRDDAGETGLLQSIGASDPVPELRIAALEAFARTASPDVVPFLIERLEDDNEEVRRAVATALVGRTGQALGTRPEGWRKWWAAQANPRGASR